jgi:glutamyl-tRNA synthetase
MASLQRTTRLAPSPTGALHLGNARTFLINWALAKQNHWQIVLRIEDLDSPRVKPWAKQQAIDDLQWLQMDWDSYVGFQLDDLSPYEQAMDDLRNKQLIYPCQCTRKEIVQAQSAPHDDDHELCYPGICRPMDMAAVPKTAPDSAWRVIASDQEITYTDAFAGEQSHNVAQQVGDFVIATKAGLPAYQLAVVVDDHRQGVTDIVRGDDLLRSAARQMWLYQCLGHDPLPTYWHLPLVLGQDGRRLAKRHGDTRLSYYRDGGTPAEKIIGLIAYWSGVQSQREPMSANEFAQRFDINKLSNDPVTFTDEDDQWLITN